VSVANLPDLNACLNAVATELICSGLVAIKRGKECAHVILMLSAVGVSALFLVSYLIYHFNVGSVKFQGEGAIRVVYFVILISHIVLAAVQVPLIALTVYWGQRDRRARHRKMAVVTAPVWLYVSVTGVAVFLFLKTAGA